MYTITQLNREAKKFELRLVKGEGYFYWTGLNDDVQEKINNATYGTRALETSIYVFKFSHLSEQKWKDEIEKIKKAIN